MASIYLVLTKYTLRKVQKIRVILGKSENTFGLLQWVSMRNRIFEHAEKLRPFGSKIILQKYTS